MNTTVSTVRVSSGLDLVDRMLSPKLSCRIRSWFTPRVDRIWRALSMNPLGPQRKNVGAFRSVTLRVPEASESQIREASQHLADQIVSEFEHKFKTGQTTHRQI